MTQALEITGLEGLPEVSRGNDLAALIREAASRQQAQLDGGTIVVVAQKIVSKAEGAVVDLRTVTPSPLAEQWARQWKLDARLIEVVFQESRRIVRMERGVIITETCHGFVAANAGVDRSNVPGEEWVTLLPKDPDASARRLHQQLGCGAVIVSDTFGRPWREGLVNVAIGVSGLDAVEDLRGTTDRQGRPLEATVVAVADELAAAASLVMRKSAGVPVALIRGYAWRAAEGSARQLVRPPDRDLFR